MVELPDSIRNAMLRAIGQERERLDALAAEIPAAVGVDESPAVSSLASELIRAYVTDRALIEATTLIDAEGDPAREVEPFRDSLLYSLALSVAGRMLDAGEVPAGQPLDARPAALLDVLDRAYAAVADAEI